MDNLDDIFLLELDKRGIKNSLILDNICTVIIDDQDINLNIENLRRTYKKDRDINVVVDFINNIIDNNINSENLSTWNALRSYVRYSLESSPSQNFVSKKITNDLYQVYTYLSIDKSKVIYIGYSMLSRWGVEKEDIIQAAEVNMNKIANEVKLEVENFDGVKIGMFCMEETFLKASVILADTFHDLVFPTHGWPVYIVAPCRDFVYVISEKDAEFLGNLGNTVINEYHNSGYPVTQEVLMVSDKGVQAIGTFANS
jgi:hypothetical protein